MDDSGDIPEPVSAVERRVATPVDIPRGPPLLSEEEKHPAEWRRSPPKIGDNGKDSLDNTQDVIPEKTVANDGPKAPDGGYGWVIVFAVFCIHVILDGIQFSFGMLLPRIAEEFNASSSTVSWVVSMLMGMTFFCGPVSSILSEKYGHRIVACVGAVIAFCGAVSGSFSTQVWHLAITYGLLMGVGFGGIYLPAIVSVATWFDKRRAMAMGIAVCGSGIGIYAMSNLIPLLFAEYGLHGTLLFEGAIVLHALIFSALLRPLPATKKLDVKADKSDRRHSLEMENLDKKEVTEVSVASGGRTVEALSEVNVPTGCWGKVLKKVPVFGLWQYWVMLCVVAISGFSGYIPFSFLPARAEKEAGVTAADTGLLVTICGVCNLAGRLLAGILADQKWCNRYLLYCSAFVISGVTTAFSIYCDTFTGFAIYGGIYGFTGGVIIALQSIVMSDIVGIERFSGAFGISLFVLGAAALFGTPTAGWIVDRQGDHKLAFIIFGILMAVGGVVFLPVPLANFFQRCFKGRRSQTPRPAA